jgi:hypothetical protein
MDAAGIDPQVLSLTSRGAERLEGDDARALARELNDFLADRVLGTRHPCDGRHRPWMRCREQEFLFRDRRRLFGSELLDLAGRVADDRG